MKRVAVIGRGFAGLTTALKLLIKGYDVTIVAPRDDPACGSRAAHGTCVMKGLLESDQELFGLKMRGHRTFLEWLKVVEKISGIDVPKIFGVTERFCDLASFRKEAQRIYKNRFLGAFCVREMSGDDRVEYFYPQDYWIDTDVYLQALEKACDVSGGKHLFERVLKIETDAKPKLLFESRVVAEYDAAVICAGIGSPDLLSGDYKNANQIKFYGASGCTFVGDQSVDSAQAFVKQLQAVTLFKTKVYLGSTTESVHPLDGRYRFSQEDVDSPNLTKQIIRNVGVRVEMENLKLRWGVRLRTQNRKPLVGVCGDSRVLVNSGYYKSGVSLAHLGAEIIEQMIEFRR